MKVGKLKIENFKGIKDLELDIEGKSIKIEGENGIGKSSIADAINWLLFGKDSLGNVKFDVKPIGKTGVNTVVVAKFILLGEFKELDVTRAGGQESEFINGVQETESIILKREYKEKYTRKTGSTEKSLTGHTTDYFIDENPVKEKDYTSKIDEICGEETFKILTNPLQFAKLNWTKQREIMCKIIDSKEIEKEILKNEKFETIRSLIDDHEKSKKDLNSQKKKINEKLREIPTRIDEVEKTVVEYAENFKQEQEAKIKKLELKLKLDKEHNNNLQKKIDSIAEKIYGNIADKRSQIDKINKEKFNNLQSAIDKKNKQKEDLNSDIQKKKLFIENYVKASENILKLKANMSEIQTDIEIIENDRDSLDIDLDKARVSWHDAKNSKFEIDEDTKTCKACGQELPDDLKNTKIEKLKKDFESDKRLKLDEISTNGKKLKSKKENIDNLLIKKFEEFEKLGKTLNGIKVPEINIDEIEGEIKTLLEEIEKINIDITNPGEVSNEVILLEKEIESLNQSIAKATESIQTISTTKTEDSIIFEKGELIRYNNNLEKLQRIKLLKAELKKFADKETDIQEQIVLLEEFYIQKMSVLETKLSSYFGGNIGFKVFDQLINGGIRETFEITVNKVPWKSVNSSGKIRAGLNIIDKLAEYYKFRPFVIIDNSESITDFPVIENQLILLGVKKGVKELKINEF